MENNQILQHVINGVGIEILNYKKDYVGLQFSNANGYYLLNKSFHLTYDGGSTGKSTNEFKLILRPLSDLTKEIEIDGEKHVPIDYFFIGDDGDNILNAFQSNNNPDVIEYSLIQILLKHHFDVFGLIDKGLAININTLENE